MRLSTSLFILVVLLSSVFAEAKGKNDFSLYLGGGTGRAGTSMTQDSNKASFSGWGGQGTVGVQVPISGNFGLRSDLNYATADFQNAAGTTQTLENGTLTQIYGKLGFAFKRVELGGGYGNSSLKTKLVSASGTSSQATYAGTTMLGYGALSFDMESSARFQIYGEYSTGQLGEWTSSGYKVTLNLFLLFDL